jgi:hypothetical protein
MKGGGACAVLVPLLKYIYLTDDADSDQADFILDTGEIREGIYRGASL